MAIKKPELYNLILSGKHSEALNTLLHQSFPAIARLRSRNKGGKKPRTFTLIRTDENEIYCVQQKPCAAYMITSYLLKVCPEHLLLGHHVPCSVLNVFTIPTTIWFKAQSTALCILLSATVEDIYVLSAIQRANLVDHYHWRSMLMHVKELPGLVHS